MIKLIKNKWSMGIEIMLWNKRSMSTSVQHNQQNFFLGLICAERLHGIYNIWSHGNKLCVFFHEYNDKLPVQ